MAGAERNHRSERYYTVNAIVGGMVLECFLASRTFLPVEQVGVLPRFTEEHLHSSYELLICKAGSGFQFVNGVGHMYEKNAVFVFPPFIKHANISDGEADEIRYSIRFELPEGPRAGGDVAPALAGALRHLREEECFHFVAEQPLLGLIDLLAQTIRLDQTAAEIVVGGLLSAILGYVFQNMSLIAEQTTGPQSGENLLGDMTRRKFLLDYYFDHLMYKNGESEARMEDLCAQLHLSPSQLNRVLKETYGTSFKQKSIEVRLAYIKYFLKYSDLSISEIAQRTNFATDSNFSLFFKQHGGMSPTQYRRLEKIELPDLKIGP